MTREELESIRNRLANCGEIIAGRFIPRYPGYSVFVNNAPEDVSALIAGIEEAWFQNDELSKCDCGKTLSSGKCRICDNDE